VKTKEQDLCAIPEVKLVKKNELKNLKDLVNSLIYHLGLEVIDNNAPLPPPPKFIFRKKK